MSHVNVGIIGVGNCASSMVQGIEYYGLQGDNHVGLTNPVCGGYAVEDIRISSAFDADGSKVGKDLSEAIWSTPNNALKFADVPQLGVTVDDGVLSDGVGTGSADRIDARGHATVDGVADKLQETGTDVVVNFLPTGSQRASEIYAEAALRAGCAFVNCIPSTIARSPDWADRFEVAGLPLAGDDLKSQFGSTLVHRALMDLLSSNGVELRSTYQIVAGGNMDFVNLQDPDRVQSKKATKVEGMGSARSGSERAHFGAEYLPFLQDRKVAYIRLEAETFGGTTFDLELRMSVEDSPSAAGNVLDAVRYMKLAMDRGISGVIDPVSLLLMKAPPTSRARPSSKNWDGFPGV